MPAPRKRGGAAVAAEPDTLEDLAGPLEQLPQLFGASQHSVASHRKNINTLHSLFLRCAQVTTLSSNGKNIKLSGERMFGEAFRNAVVYPLGVKKGVEQADRVIKFVGGFVAFAVEHDLKLAEAKGEDDEDDFEGPSSRLVAQLLAFLLRGFQAKNKIARFRCVQLVALMVNSLGEIDDDTYQHLKTALLERVHDKEATVRMQAVVALAKLQEADEPDEDEEEDEDELTVTQVLIDVLTHDPAAEVRRAALFNLIPSPQSLPALISRTLDLDAINRRASFAHVLVDVPCSSLTRSQREEAIGRGLRDREEGVQKAAKKLVAKWAEDAGGVIEFLEHFDVFEGKVAEKVLQAVFDVSPGLAENVDFGDAFYESLTPYSAFTARVFFNHLRTLEDPRLVDIEPVVTALAFYIQAQWTQLVVLLESEEHDEDVELTQEFIVGELVTMAVNADYGDEIGRRKMFELMREMLSNFSLPPSLVPKCLDVLLKVNTSEKEFMRIVVEIVQALRADSELMTSEDENADDDEEVDEDEDEEAFLARRAAAKAARYAAMAPADIQRRKDLDLRCLVVVKALLERVMGVSDEPELRVGVGDVVDGGPPALQENSMLHGLVIELVVPAIKQKDSEVRASGLVCLGLVSLLDKATALDSFQLLARQSQDTEGELQVKILETLFDLLVLHGVNFGAERGFGADIILGFLMSSLEQEEPEVAATAVVGIAKLMLAGMVTDEEILSRLALLYFASETIDNQVLRQCLSYFFPVYCYSNPVNQRRVANVFLPTLELLKGVYDDLGDKAAMVAPLQIGLQLIDWTDPQKAIDVQGVPVDEDIHFDLAMLMVKKLYQEEQKDERKLLCQLLPKLYIPEEIADLQVKSLLWLIASLKVTRPLADTVSKNALDRFEKALIKTFGERVEALSEEDLAEAVEMKETQDFVAQLVAEDDGSEDEDDEGEEDEEEDEESEEEQSEEE